MSRNDAGPGSSQRQHIFLCCNVAGHTATRVQIDERENPIEHGVARMQDVGVTNENYRIPVGVCRRHMKNKRLMAVQVECHRVRKRNLGQSIGSHCCVVVCAGLDLLREA